MELAAHTSLINQDATVLNSENKIHPEGTDRNMVGFFPQFKALLWQNILVKKRKRTDLLLEILTPIIFMALLAIVQNYLKPDVKPSRKFPVHNLSDFGSPFSSSSKIYAAPNTNEVDTWMQDIVAQLDGPPTYQLFASAEDAEKEYRKSKTNVTAGIIFGYNGSSTSYAIRTSYGELPVEQAYNKDKGTCRDKESGTGVDDCNVNKYLSLGFSQLQIAVDNALLRSLGIVSPNPDSRQVQVQMMDKDEFQPSTEHLQTFAAIYFVYCFAFLANFLTLRVVSDKENKIRPGMLMMGLRASAYWLSWTLIYVVLLVIVVAVMILIVYVADILTQSNLFLLYLILLLYGFTFIALAFMVTPLFSKASSAAVLVGFVPVKITVLYMIVSQNSEPGSYDANISPALHGILCLFSPVALATIINKAMYLDIHEAGLNFDDWLTYGDFPIYIPIVMLVVDIILYSLVGVWLEHTAPREEGARMNPMRFLRPSYWMQVHRRRKEQEAMRHQQPHIDMEPVPPDMEGKVALKIYNLTKTFDVKKKKDVIGLQGVCLKAYEGQITCVLGHKESGKTTLMNILTGIYPPSLGTASLKGCDVVDSADMEKLRGDCGVCFQQNSFISELTCKEQLMFYAKIKGVPADSVQNVVDQCLREVDLATQADTFPDDLSKAQKRKLCLAIALVGNPKYIFLDEPTSGMDPYSRRRIWSVLKSHKQRGQMLLFTTNSMDEANVVADRKAYIQKGKVKCCGSSSYLKDKLGLTYHLTMVMDSSSRSPEVTAFLQGLLPGVQLEHSQGNVLGFSLPRHHVSRFAELFGYLEKERSRFGIMSYDITMDTLEEVFFKLDGNDVDEPETGTEGYPTNGTYQHVDQHQVTMTMNAPESNVGKYYQNLDQGRSLNGRMFITLVKVRFLQMLRNRAARFFLWFLPLVLLLTGLLLAKYAKNTNYGSDDPIKITPDLYLDQNSKLLIFDNQNVPDSQAVIDDFKRNYGVDSYPVGTKNTSDVAPHNVGLQLEGVSGQFLMDFVALYNDSAVHSLAVALNLASQSALDLASKTEQIKVTSLPWPEIREKMGDMKRTLEVPLLIGLAFLLLMPAFTTDIYEDFYFRMRNQLRIAGVSSCIYWGSAYFVDLLVYLVLCIVTIVIIIAVQIKGFDSTGAIVTIIILFITNIPMNIIFGLLMSISYFRKGTSASGLPLFLSFSSILPLMFVSDMDSGSGDFSVILHYAMCIINPPYILMGGLFYVFKVYWTSTYTDEEHSVGVYFEFDNNILIAVIMPVVYTILLFWRLRTVNGMLLEASNNPVTTPTVNTDKLEDEDADVKAERERVENLLTYNADMPVVYTTQLRKTFAKPIKCACLKKGEVKAQRAVRNLSIGVNKGEIVGLLGPDGAGKSSTLDMVAREMVPSAGKVTRPQANEDSLGYCMEVDSLWKFITLEEHIQYLATLHGVPSNVVDGLVEYHIRGMKLEEHRKEIVTHVSGGTKRKLCYILSMLGNPELLLLDEPGANMQFQSKRLLWDTIRANILNTNRAALLSTNDVEEALALCQRLGIMVNGQLRCLGTIEHLQNKLCSSYVLQVKLRSFTSPNPEVEAMMDRLEENLKHSLPNLEKMDRFKEWAQYSIQKEYITSLSKVYADLENCKKYHELEEYNFGRMTLGQIFFFYAKQQLEEDEVTV